MKKLFFALVALLSSVMVQKADAQILDFEGMPPYRLGVFAAYSRPTFSGTGYKFTSAVQAGLDLMVSGDVVLDNTFLRFDLEYAMKGANGAEEIDFNGIKTPVKNVHYTSHYIELPIHVGYAYPLNSAITVLAETGPFLAFGLGGNVDYDTAVADKDFFSDYNASRFDYGWGVRAGIVLNQRLEIFGKYEWGFKNLNKQFLQNNGLSVGAVLYFDYE